MAFTTESLQPVEVGRQPGAPSEFSLPSKEFIGYDPKGTQSITGSPLVKSEATPQANPAAAPIPKVPEKESITLSKEVSAIARRDMAQRQKEKQLAERERTFAQKMADADKYQKLTEKLKNKDYSAIDELGVAYEEIVKHELNKESSKDPAQERVRQLEERLTALQKAREEDQVKQYESNQLAWKEAIKKEVTDNAEFSTIKELNAEDIVLQHINDSFEEDGIELTVEQAAKEIELALLERAEKFSSISKIKNRASDAKVLGAPKTEAKTITQNMTVTSRETKPKPFHLMSEAEQIAEAIRRVQAAKLQR